MIEIISKDIQDKTFVAHILIDGKEMKFCEQPPINYTDEQLIERIRYYMERYPEDL